ncbi:MAG: hypothetical protein HYZ37_16995 [Candidatus Solibacter usitatus]|nr:hypothetical protein [Candidatus Solibacter usitatus]
MLRILAIFCAFAAHAYAALLTDNLGTVKLVESRPLSITDKPVWEDYGLLEAESGKYSGGGRTFSVSAWRLKDPTGAQGVFRWMRPPGAGAGDKDALNYTKLAASSGDLHWMTFGNYVLHFAGGMPTLDELKIFLFQLPKVDQSAMPPVLEYVVADGMMPGTDRFISGPASLEKFFPTVQPSTAGFHFGTEAVAARYKGRTGELEMAIFYYPTNPMAKERQPEFQKIAGAMVKRVGPLIAIVSAPANADDAERLLAKVNYQATLTINEGRPGGKIRSVGDLLISIFTLVGVLIALCITAGFMLFGSRALRRRMAGGKDGDPMTMLHLGDR